MEFVSSTMAAEDRTRWKGVVAKSYVVPQHPCKVMGQTRLDVLSKMSKFCLIWEIRKSEQSQTPDTAAMHGQQSDLI